MEKQNKKLEREHQAEILPILYSRNFLQKNDEGEFAISVYSGTLTINCVREQLNRIRKAFPELNTDFYDVLTDRIKILGFTDNRLIDAVNNLIDNFDYPRPTVSQILSWDKRVKVYTYPQMVEMVNKSGGVVTIWDKYKVIEWSSPMSIWANIADIEYYKLKIKKPDSM